MININSHETEELFNLDHLLQVVARLRDPDLGCPWDIEQNFKSIVSSTLEECYELIDAIENEDFEQVKEELGDVLFQVVFYAQLGSENSLFDLSSVIDALVRKQLHVVPLRDETTNKT